MCPCQDITLAHCACLAVHSPDRTSLHVTSLRGGRCHVARPCDGHHFAMSLNNAVATTSPVLKRSVSPTLLHRPAPTSSPNDAMAAMILNCMVAPPCLDKVCITLSCFADPLTFCTHTGIASHTTTVSHTGSPSIGVPFFFVSEFMLTRCCHTITTTLMT